MKNFLALITASLCLTIAGFSQVNPSYQQFNTNHFLTNGSPWKIGIRTNDFELVNLTVVSNAFINAMFVDNLTVSNVFIGNHFHTTNITAVNVNVSNVLNVTSNIFLGGTNVVELFGLWRTNAAQGGITNFSVGTYPSVWVQRGVFRVGVNAGSARAYIHDLDGTIVAADGNFQVTADGAGLFGSGPVKARIEGFDGSANFGTSLIYASNYFQVVVPSVAGSAPEFEIDTNGIIHFSEDRVTITPDGAFRASRLANNSSSQTLVGDDQVVTVSGANSFGYVLLDSDNATPASDRTFVLSQGTNGQLAMLIWTNTGVTGELLDNSANQGAGNVRLSRDWVPAQYDSLLLIGRGNDWVELARTPGGSQQVLVYTTTDPNTDMITPDDPTAPAIAYKDDGQGPIWYWDTGDTTWR